MKTKPENDISFALQMLQEAIDKVNSPADRKPLRRAMEHLSEALKEEADRWYDKGANEGYTAGLEDGFNGGKWEGRAKGYIAGYEDGRNARRHLLAS